MKHLLHPTTLHTIRPIPRLPPVISTFLFATEKRDGIGEVVVVVMMDDDPPNEREREDVVVRCVNRYKDLQRTIHLDATIHFTGTELCTIGCVPKTFPYRLTLKWDRKILWGAVTSIESLIRGSVVVIC
jgi:hypothetical protein